MAGGEEAEEVQEHSEGFGSDRKGSADTWRQQGQAEMVVLYLIGRNLKK